MLFHRFATFVCLLGLLWPSVGFPATDAVQHNAFKPAPQGQQVPPLWVKNAQGADINLKTLWNEAAGRTIYLHLWAPSCPPCVSEIKAMDTLWPALTAKGVTVIVLAEDHDGAVTVPAFASRYGIKTLPLIIDAGRLLWLQLQPRGLPMTYQLDEQGHILSVHEGVLDWRSLL
jgi:AhpC/TSA family.